MKLAFTTYSYSCLFEIAECVAQHHVNAGTSGLDSKMLGVILKPLLVRSLN